MKMMRNRQRLGIISGHMRNSAFTWLCHSMSSVLKRIIYRYMNICIVGTIIIAHRYWWTLCLILGLTSSLKSRMIVGIIIVIIDIIDCANCRVVATSFINRITNSSYLLINFIFGYFNWRIRWWWLGYSWNDHFWKVNSKWLDCKCNLIF